MRVQLSHNCTFDSVVSTVLSAIVGDSYRFLVNGL